jgi:hypothetical protein
MRKRIVGGVVVVGLVASVGVAWAALGGFLSVPNIAQGLVNGSGTSSCQTTGVDFDVPDPVFDSVLSTYVVTEIGFSGISPACVTLGTAIIDLTMVEGGSSAILATASEGSIGSTGLFTLSAPVPFDDAVNASFNYLVKNN